MSELKKKLQDEMKQAMRDKDTLKLSTVRGIIAEVKKAEIDTKKDFGDEDVSSLVQKEIKKRRDALQFAKDANREDLVAQNNAEIEILKTYLGEQITEEKLSELILALIQSGSDNLGKIMGALNKDHKGKFDGTVASNLAKNLLEKKA